MQKSTSAFEYFKIYNEMQWKPPNLKAKQIAYKSKLYIKQWMLQAANHGKWPIVLSCDSTLL